MFGALIGLLSWVAAAAATMFLLSLFGRLTNTTFVTKSGRRIEPYKTSKERKMIKEQERYKQDVVQLNFFCNMFSDKKFVKQHYNSEVERFLASDNMFNLVNPHDPSFEAFRIISRGNMDVALKHFEILNSMKNDGLIDRDEYLKRGKELYKKLSGEH